MAVISVLWWSVPSMQKEQLPQLKALGVKDSKMLTDQRSVRWRRKSKNGSLPIAHRHAQQIQRDPTKYNTVE